MLDGYDYTMIILACGVSLRLVLGVLFDFLTSRKNYPRGYADIKQKLLSESEQKSNKNTSDHPQNI